MASNEDASASESGHDETTNQQGTSGEEVPDNLQEDQNTSNEVPNDLPDDNVSGQEVPEDIKDDNPYQTTGQKILATAEGVGRGLAGPTEAAISKSGLLGAVTGVPNAEKLLGITPEEISARQEANPELATAGEIGGLGAGLATGTGVGGLATKLGTKLAPRALGAIGSAVLANGIASGAIQGSDEISKAILGHGNPQTPVSNILTAGALGLFTGGLGEGLGATSSTISSKIGNRLNNFMENLASKATGGNAAASAAAGLGFTQGGIQGWYDGDNFLDRAKKALFGGAKNAALGYTSTKALQYATPMILKAAANLSKKINPAPPVTDPYISDALNRLGIVRNETVVTPEMADSFINYGGNIAKGENRISNAIANVFKTTGTPTIDLIKTDQNKRDALDKYISQESPYEQLQGSSSPVGYAEGGHVEKPTEDINHIANHFPDQNIMLNMAKGRIYNYLNSQRPQNTAPALPFDQNVPDKRQKKSYDKALDIANNPMNIMGHITNGTLEPEHMNHFSNLYPELKDHLQKKVMDNIVQGQLDGKKPPYKVRQSLSLFMGAPLSSDLTPQNIQAAQAVFAKPQPQQMEPPQKNKKNTNSLSKAPSQFLTGNQARIANERKS